MLARARAGEPAGLVVTATEQTAGRGRHGRSWASPPGNLYASLLLRPALAMAEAGGLALVVAVALAEAVEALTPGLPRIGLKWPNDLLLGEAKLAGILLEGEAAPGGRCGFVVVGCGVNLAHAPHDLDRATVALADLPGVVVPAAAALLDRFLDGLGTALDEHARAGLGPARQRWLARAHGLGRRVTVRPGAQALSGVFAGLDERGALLLRTDEGRTVTITAGEVFLA